MKIINLLKSTIIIGFIVSSLTSFATAAAPGHIKIQSTVEVLKTFVENGQKVQRLVPAKKVLPDTTLFYKNSFTNISQVPADNVKLINPIPAHTLYITGSAQGENTNITFSVNNGKSWGTPETLTVLDANGEAKIAEAKDYTHVRWIYNKNLAPSEMKNVSFQARLL